MTQGNLQIHTENILPIIKKWLYSDRDVFVRELVSNACDAMQKCKVLRDAKELDFNDDELRLDIDIDKEKRTLTFSDRGIGMSADEVVKYIAQIAFSGAEEFVQKYKGKESTDAIIGHFGLGFYSAYMVAEKVVINTLSYKSGEKAALWECDGGATYNLEKGTKESRGTTITLHLDKDSDEYLEESKIRGILNKYCAFLPFPIYLNGSQINHKDPLWLKNPADCKEEEYKEFFNLLYPMDPEPLFWVHLNVYYPFHLKGILYFPRITPRFDWNKSHIKLFCNRVFVSDNCKDLLPDYLTVLSGAIDSPDIPLNVSRSFLQMDRTVRQVGSHISKKIADKLSSLFNSERENFTKAWQDIEIFVKLGALQDEKFFERIKELLIWKTTDGNFLTTDEYLSKIKPISENKIFYTTDEKIAPPLLNLYKDKGIEVVVANGHVDAALISFLETKIDLLKFQRVDGGLDNAILDTAQDSSQETSQDFVKIAEFFKSAIDEDVEVEVKKLSSEKLSSLIVIDESNRRLRDYMAFSNSALGAFPSKKTFVVNTASKLVQSIAKLKDKDETLAKNMAKHLYELSLLSQKELDPKDLGSFIESSCQVLEEMAAKL